MRYSASHLGVSTLMFGVGRKTGRETVKSERRCRYWRTLRTAMTLLGVHVLVFRVPSASAMAIVKTGVHLASRSCGLGFGVAWLSLLYLRKVFSFAGDR